MSTTPLEPGRYVHLKNGKPMWLLEFYPDGERAKTRRLDGRGCHYQGPMKLSTIRERYKREDPPSGV